MNTIKLVLLLLAVSAAGLNAGDLGAVHTVYALPMAHGLEQYLVNALTSEHVFVIVTDPKLADAVLTSSVGAGLQEKLNSLLEVPPPEKPEPKDDAKDAGKGKSSSLLDTMNKLDSPGMTSSVGRTKGTIFLVETKSRQVVWSVYELPKDSSSKELDRTASVIVSRLKKDLGLKKK